MKHAAGIGAKKSFRRFELFRRARVCFCNSQWTPRSPILNNCTLTSNTVWEAYCCLCGEEDCSGGAGAYASTLNDCTLAGNLAVYGGGAVHCSTLVDCILTNNFGGAAYKSELTDCTMANNSGLARAWTHLLPARSGCALSLREMDSLVPTQSALRAFVPHGGTNSFQRHPGASSLFARSQRVQVAGELVPQDHTDEPAERLLEKLKSTKYG